MISKMKQACGYDYTNKLQNMYQDIEVSKNLNESYRKQITSEIPLDFRIKVLSHGSWPMEQMIEFNFPEVLTKQIDSFTGFYNRKFSGRKLKWLPKLSKAEIVMHGKKSRYSIKVRGFFCVDTT